VDPGRDQGGLTVKQVEFLCYEGREGLFGGAAGPGQVGRLLMAALQYVEQPGYTALILRRTYKQLAKADSILNKSKEWLWGKGEVQRREHKFWTFPNGNTLEFGHMEHEDSVDYQGGAGRSSAWTRRPSSPSHARVPAHPAAAAGRRRSRSGGGRVEPRRAGSRLRSRAGTSRTPTAATPAPGPAVLSRPARRQPEHRPADYIETLKESGVDPLTLAQLLDGDWDAVPGGRFRRDWFTRRWTRRGDYIQVRDRDGRLEYEFMPGEAVARFITVDPPPRRRGR
jgi:hypothetical protein